MNKCTRRNFLKVTTLLPFLPLLVTKLRPSTAVPSGPELAQLKPSASVDLSRLLRCIAEVETGNDDTKVGRNGERSKYQITQQVWHQNMELIATEFGTVHLYYSFFINCYGKIAEQCALRHLVWLQEKFDTPYWLAHAWRAGRNRTLGYVKGPATSAIFHPYASRVSNLYHDASFRPQ